MKRGIVSSILLLIMAAWSYGGETIITFDGYTKAETLTNFPVRIEISSDTICQFDVDGGYSMFATTNGHDLRFTQGTNSLDYEIETWNTNGSSYIWVKVPLLSQNDTIAMGFAVETNSLPCLTNGTVWAEDYSFVWHFADGTGNVASDSSSNEYNGALWFMAGDEWVPGYIGECLDFDGVDDSVISTFTADQSTGTVGVTFSAWVYPRAVGGNWDRIFDGDSGAWDWSLVQSFSGWAYFDGFGFHNPSVSVDIGAWQHISAVFDPVIGGVRFYKNGSQSTSLLLDYDASSGAIKVGGDNTGDEFYGMIDEARVSAATRSSNWVWAAYASQLTNSTFATQGGVGNSGGASNITQESATLNGYLCQTSGPTTVKFYWGKTDGGTNFGSWQNVENMGVQDIGLTSFPISNLTFNAEYYYRTYASNTSWDVWSAASSSFHMAPHASVLRKRSITFSGYTGASDLTNFPMLVRLSETNTPGFTYAEFGSSRGYDLRFHDETSYLNYEIDEWNTNGESTVWVQIPVLSGTNTQIKMLYGDPNVQSQPDYATNGAMWPTSDYVCVYHCSEGTGTNLYDSTAAQNDAIAFNLTASDWTNGAVGTGINLNGVDQYVSLGAPASTFGIGGSNPRVTSYMLTVNDYTVVGYTHSKGGPGSRGSDSMFVRGTTNDYTMENNGSNREFSNTNAPGNFVQVFNINWQLPGIDEQYIFMDGIQRSGNLDNLGTQDDWNVQFGAKNGNNDNADIQLDEIRIMRVNMSEDYAEDWALAQTLNVNSNSTFQSVSAPIPITYLKTSSGRFIKDADGNYIVLW